ncbi:MAG: bifunctional proline dehydrogenase/L-glutamate gamma-semialdehyde dehydrogenase PutA [Alphaproteobacteria bacterium]|nr:bifunctional proline dehydrogenase/L-glutamate gamma-semialdehyde dehydrogenase PutA [Alphaproteobacteria bacterium]
MAPASKASLPLASLRARIRDAALPDEGLALADALRSAGIESDVRARMVTRATKLVRLIREQSDPGLMEVFLAEYGLSTDEGVALMCLAEALLRVPDDDTIDALIEDKIAPSTWGKHLGHSSSSLVNASTWALMITGKVLNDEDQQGLVGALRSAIRRLGEPVIRTAVERAMRELGQQFVLGRDIEEAMERAAEREAQGFTHSYDMLGEAARTEDDARRYHLAYARAITALARACRSADSRENPGISVKLSALHPRYEALKRDRVMAELMPRAKSLALLAKSAGMGFNIDAEEADRLDLSLDVIEALLTDPALGGWDGFGVVVQAYGPRATHVIDWLHALAETLDRRLMVRLVKGAYWDTEIKRAQTLGIPEFPVFTRKASTDVSYIACAKKLLSMTDRIYPQFATHNAHTVAAVLELAEERDSFEFQRLHGMGEALHDRVLETEGTRCRIYAPVGAHRDLLAYLVRRLLENGANSSFVNQIVDEDVPPEEVAADPFEAVLAYLPNAAHPRITPPPALFVPDRGNAKGWDLADPLDLAAIEKARAPFATETWQTAPMIAGPVEGGARRQICNPARAQDRVGEVIEASEADIRTALGAARSWSDRPAPAIAAVLNRAADLYEAHAGAFFALAAREAGKTLLDCIGELREAVDFLRYYATEAVRLESVQARGVVACISPWNFPLAIFTGQVSAALAAGNGVIAKPAEATPLIASMAVGLLHQAGVPREVLQLLPGAGPVVGGAFSAAPEIDGLCFTGSTATAQRINRTMAAHLAPDAPLIAETGGLNAMIVDSTALPEQAVRDILASAFQSAGQRCSALRLLYLQADIAKTVKTMLFGAMDELSLGDPWDPATDIGPVIDQPARARILAHIETAKSEGRLLKQLAAPADGTFVGPAVLKVDGIGDLAEEIFGPVLHLATFEAEEIDQVVRAINDSGYGLTFGLHTRIDDRVQAIVDDLKIGNIYVNRNQIGAVVGSQPFGGEGLSGTGPKAGGPHYVERFKAQTNGVGEPSDGRRVGTDEVISALLALPPTPMEETACFDLPGPTGESNRLFLHARGPLLCLGPGKEAAIAQAIAARATGCPALAIAPGIDDGLSGCLDLADLEAIPGIAGVVFWAPPDAARPARQALAARSGPIVPLISAAEIGAFCQVERHLCIDTTAAGGNATLLSEVAD